MGQAGSIDGKSQRLKISCYCPLKLTDPKKHRIIIGQKIQIRPWFPGKLIFIILMVVLLRAVPALHVGLLNIDIVKQEMVFWEHDCEKNLLSKWQLGTRRKISKPSNNIWW